MSALKDLPARILVLALLLQAAAFYAVASREELLPRIDALSDAFHRRYYARTAPART